MRFLLALTLFGLVFAVRKRYDGYKVLEITAHTDAQRTAVHALNDNIELDFWHEPRALGMPSYLMVPPQELINVYQYLYYNHVNYTVWRENVQENLDKEWARLDARYAKNNRDYNPNDYNILEDIMDEMDSWVANCPSGFTCRNDNIGNSEEGHPLKVFRISRNGANNRAYFIDSAIHAREWLAPATVMRFTASLLSGYGQDQDSTDMLNNYDWHVLPIVNPDGYAFSWVVDRLWRKSRNINVGSTCVGTDLNRNFDAYWMNAGTSGNPCSSTFGGLGAASEPEVQAVQNEARRLGSTLEAYVSFHTAAQMWLHPWGHTEFGLCVYADDHDDMLDAASAATDAILATSGIPWEAGNCCEVIYPASGSTMDYVKASAGVKYTFTPELRGPGFDPPASAIQPSFNEVRNGMISMVRHIAAIERSK